MNQYQTRVDCEVAGQWRVAGFPFSLTDTQAAELLPPRGNVVALYTGPATTAGDTTADTTAENADENATDNKEPQHARLGRNKRGRGKPAR